MGQIVWTVHARSDLVAIHDYISRDSALVALRLVSRISAAVERLREFAESGRIVPEHQRSGVRENIIRPYRVAYRNVGDEIRILRVHHGARIFRLDDIENAG